MAKGNRGQQQQQQQTGTGDEAAAPMEVMEVPGAPDIAPTAEEAAARDAAVAANMAEAAEARARKASADPHQAERDELAAVQAAIDQIEAGNREAAELVAGWKTAVKTREEEIKRQDDLVAAAKRAMETQWHGARGEPGQMHRAEELPGLQKRAEELRQAIG